MASRRRFIPHGENQEVLRFEPPRQMPSTYDGFVALAREGTRSRNARKNELAMTARTKGFRQRAGGFIPRSGGENTAIAANPETKLKNERHFAKERVKEKWAEEDISPKRIKQWANFAAANVEAKGRGKYWSWRLDALMQLGFLTEAIRDDGTITEDTIKGSENSRTAVDTYLVDLKIFASKPEGGRRQWIARNHTRRREAEMTWARNYSDGLTRDEYEKLYLEAYGSAWSRYKFWTAAETEYKDRMRAINNTEPVWANPPQEVYNGTPEDQGIVEVKFYEEDLGRIVIEDL